MNTVNENIQHYLCGCNNGCLLNEPHLCIVDASQEHDIQHQQGQAEVDEGLTSYAATQFPDRDAVKQLKYSTRIQIGFASY